MRHPPVYDVIVCGLGINGTAALYYLSQFKGLKVLGIEAKQPGHSGGGSYGQTRLLRRSYFDAPEYIPLVSRSLELWERLQLGSPHPLFHRTGLLFLGPRQNPLFENIRLCASKHSLRIETVATAHAREQFPFLRIPDPFQVLFEPEALVLLPENLIPFLLSEAQTSASVEISVENPVFHLEIQEELVFVSTSAGVFTAKKALVAAGGWTKFLLPELALPIEFKESPQFWFRELARAPRAGVPFIFSSAEDFIYGFPDCGIGVKMASYHPGRTLPTPEDRSAHSTHGLVQIQSCIENHFPYLDPKPTGHHTCFLDMGPGENLILDFYPGSRNVVMMTAGSGHGFKMAPALATAAIEMLQTGRPVAQTGFLSLELISKPQMRGATEGRAEAYPGYAAQTARPSNDADGVLK
ncbi:MAG: N-methyl-L-tryptophan oxidase [Bdellovibrionales bacterium]